MAPFYGRGPTTFCKNVKKGNYLMATEPLQEGNLLFTTKFPDIPGNLIKLGSRKGWADLGTTQLFWTWDPWIGNPAP